MTLAKLIHDLTCGDSSEGDCPRWDGDRPWNQRHRDYYQARAESVMTQLEPVIGSANVAVACQVILAEMG